VRLADERNTKRLWGLRQPQILTRDGCENRPIFIHSLDGISHRDSYQRAPHFGGRGNAAVNDCGRNERPGGVVNHYYFAPWVERC
jgi:hypothetical protein